MQGFFFVIPSSCFLLEFLQEYLRFINKFLEGFIQNLLSTFFQEILLTFFMDFSINSSRNSGRDTTRDLSRNSFWDLYKNYSRDFCRDSLRAYYSDSSRNYYMALFAWLRYDHRHVVCDMTEILFRSMYYFYSKPFGGVFDSPKILV